jgi:hypothetical protein
MNKKKTKTNHMERLQKIEELSMAQSIEDSVTAEFIPDFLANPSVGALKRARKVVWAGYTNVDTGPERDIKRRELMKKYPDLPWRNNETESIACWLELTDNQRREVVLSTSPDKDKLQKAAKPLAIAIGNDIENKDSILLATKIYRFLLSQTQLDNQKENSDNNSLLATVSVNAAISKRIDFWRFVCMPEVSIDVNSNNTFDTWDYTLGSERYDTLSPALQRDSEIIDGMRALGITPQLFYVLDDWEAPWLRAENIFKKLSKSEQKKALEGLSDIRAVTSEWITKQTKEFDPSGIIYFSSLINYRTFIDLMDMPLLESQVEYKIILEEEKNFVKKSSRRNPTDLEATAIAQKRIIQYATEGSILANTFLGNGIYLNSEYPVQVVWKKLTLFADLPTLFYVTDKEVKNV